MNQAGFWRMVQKLDDPDGCWLWRGATRGQGTGYGCLQYQGRVRSAHHLAWEWANERTIPRGKVILHTCDVTFCVRPDHLVMGTQMDNVRDMWRKGRGRNVTADFHRTKTHCKNGHEFTPENTTIIQLRHCRACNAGRERAKRTNAQR